MRKKITLTLALIIANIIIVNACTNFLVGKKASVDGSTLISYSADSYWLYGALYHYPAAKYPEGAKMDVYEWDTGKYEKLIIGDGDAFFNSNISNISITRTPKLYQYLK